MHQEMQSVSALGIASKISKKILSGISLREESRLDSGDTNPDTCVMQRSRYSGERRYACCHRMRSCRESE